MVGGGKQVYEAADLRLLRVGQLLPEPSEIRQVSELPAAPGRGVLLFQPVHFAGRQQSPVRMAAEKVAPPSLPTFVALPEEAYATYMRVIVFKRIGRLFTQQNNTAVPVYFPYT